MHATHFIDSVAHGEVGYNTFFGGFYFSWIFSSPLAEDEEAFLRQLLGSGEIWHKQLNKCEFDVHQQMKLMLGARDLGHV